MTSQTPEQIQAEQDELDDQLHDVVVDWVEDGPPSTKALAAALAPALAAIRRHAAAAALHEQAKRLARASRDHFSQVVKYPALSPEQAEALAYGRQANTDARSLRRAAEALIMEGWTETCAAETPATREDPAEGCETPVENEGDYCPRHEPADDYDPRGEL
ncbi:hypothetical protein SEA_VIBAKI_53 [Arthrobacter phage Vibaki]|uniref:Uncharacterized protein n=1 Tax=Arthrobacter phage Vibaki TaxID=2593333 RepID=A0A514TZ08_9CAUD|nr:hypothetical protein HYP95_gp53 [Arthrobacter phage Vibaki]QDK01933.1 hypothetical protein SEA_VIBAKI_53 [Arthrobacter phage Vibaki]